MRHYVDASAAAMLLVEEAESAALAAFLDQVLADGDAVGSSLLIETELRRLGIRLAIPQERVTLVTYDERQAVTARAVGLTVAAPT